jgi:hypothetical protein
LPTAIPDRKEGMSMLAVTDMQPFPAGFQIKDIVTNSTTLSVRVGGQGPAVVLLCDSAWKKDPV